MKEENTLSLKLLIFCILVIGALVAAFTVAALRVLQELSQYMPQNMPHLNEYMANIMNLLIPSALGAGALAVLILWLLSHFTARSAMRRKAAPRERAVTAAEKTEETAGGQEAVQMLSILQRQGRFIDFIQEDLTMYSDEEVGAAVRNVHQGCKEAITEHMEFTSIMKEEEGAQVTIQPGFDTIAIRLTGNISGSPPFKGVLRHHGWRVVRVNLPRRIRSQERDWVLDPAEVEVNTGSPE